MTFCKVDTCSRTLTFKAEVDSGFCVEHIHWHLGDLRTQAELATKSRELNVARLAEMTAARDAACDRLDSWVAVLPKALQLDGERDIAALRKVGAP